MNEHQNKWINESIRTNQYIPSFPELKDEKEFNCPEYIRKKTGEKRLPTMGDPCMYCANPNCPLHPKVFM